jgi:hypothetical protein
MKTKFVILPVDGLSVDERRAVLEVLRDHVPLPAIWDIYRVKFASENAALKKVEAILDVHPEVAGKVRVSEMLGY